MSGVTARENKPTGPYDRYRALYAKLPPGAQMIGLQLWLPVVFVLAFCFCYIAAFHAPAPHGVPVAIVGSGRQPQLLASQLQASSKGALKVTTEPDLAHARADVRRGDIVAAYLPGPRSSQLVLASAAQYQLSELAQVTFTTVATAAHSTLQVDDLSPLPSYDAYGTTLFYLTLVWTIGGYMTAMFVGMMGAALKHRWRAGILVGSAAFLTLLSTLVIRFALGAVHGHFWALWGTGFVTAVAIGMVVSGLGYFFGRFITAIALILFVFLNVPASGGAYPPQFVPQPFRALHNEVSGTGTLDMLRSIVYNVGPGIGRGLLILACYAAVGLALTAIGKPFYTKRMARRAARGARPNMMVAAQMSAMAAASAAVPHGTADSRGEDTLPADGSLARRTQDEERTGRSVYASEEAGSDAAAGVTGAEA